MSVHRKRTLYNGPFNSEARSPDLGSTANGLLEQKGLPMTLESTHAVNPSRFTARPTTYNGTPMRSRLEARYAAWLDANGIRWDYEPRAFANERGQYLPDFLLHDIEILGAPRRLYVELKPTPSAITREVREKAAIIWASDPDAFLAFESQQCNVEIHTPPDVAGVVMFMQWARTAPNWTMELVIPIDMSWWRAS